MPPFGLNGIWKIWSNHLELEKMTAYDYEDLLQVSIETFNQHCLTSLGSVQYLSLMASSLNHTTCVSWRFFLIWHIGIVLWSFECTQTLLLIFCPWPWHLLVGASETFGSKCVLCFQLENWNKKELLISDGRRRAQPGEITDHQDQRQRHPRTMLKNQSVWILTPIHTTH
jgi:hypothetical protein